MQLKGVSQISNALAKELVVTGFEYENIRKIIEDRTQFKGDCVDLFEDELFKKIEKFSQYLYVVNVNTGDEYYYFTVKDLCEDTGLSIGAVNGSIYGGWLANSVFRIERLSFSSKELCKDKTHLFSKKIGKVKVRKYYTKDGKYISKPLLVIDTHTDCKKVYETARLFCEEFNIRSNNLSKYIINDWRVMSRYKIKPYIK